MKDKFFLAVGLLLVVGSFYLFLEKPAPAKYQTAVVNSVQTEKAGVVKIGNASITVEIADTEITREGGLSGRENLEIGHGMLFIFPKSDLYGFWMKDMNFPIDIIWIDESWKVIGIERSVPPETYPKIFNPISPAKYVLEVPAGYSAKENIDIGETVYFDAPK